MLTIAISIAPSVEGPWRVLRGAAELKFKVPDADIKEEPRRESRGDGSHENSGVDTTSPRARRPSDTRVYNSDDEKEDVLWGPSGRGDGPDEPEWFSDDKMKAPRTKALSSVGNTFANMMSGAWAGSSEVSPPPLNMNRPKGGAVSQTSAVGLGFEVSDEYHLADTHCLDCNFDWFVPVEIEPGKYMFRISPIAINGTHRYSEKEQLLRSRDSAFVTIS